MEPWAVTAPTSGAMESCVASVEFQLRVADSPLLTVVGLACSVTVGVAAGGGTGVVLGVGATVFLPQPKVKTATASAVSKPARPSEPEGKCMLILLSEVPVFVPPGTMSSA